jgi:hypothetical protein
MNPKKHIAWKRWCSAAVVAAGAISFAAGDASSARRLYVSVMANGGSACTPPYPQQYLGAAYAQKASPTVLVNRCTALANVQSGTTISGNSLCSDYPSTELPYYTSANLYVMDYTTGIITGSPFTSSFQPWGTTATIEFNYNGCSGTVWAQGRN